MADVPMDLAVTVDLQLESRDLREIGPDGLHGRFSYGRYGARVGVRRLLDLLAAHRIPATFFVPGSEAERHPAMIEAILADGHEIAAHGWAMEDPAGLGAEEPALLERAHAALSRTAGTAPTGWRTPTGTMTPETLRLLAGLGYRYDSSHQDDDRPYVHILKDGVRIAEIPRSEVLDDATFHAVHMPHDTLERAWREEFDALVAEGEGLPCLTLNPRGDRGSGRGSRIAAVDRFLARAAEVPGLRFRTARAIAEDLLAADAGRAYPVLDARP
ncbi:polysaccharide deacetylase family protein [Pararoseomonas indoligenes]|uniref:Chitooligosaccharide deacetylase n=1 Tax=Roseomonas indoligenes TaxID=2820811 RepID=A0A940S8H0_9PROT|nr:polysaccharide deacetylase family protein [Pararoseomonas indoligenes]MBP0495910.1 polysaccharide deacetylase family protein [Pararoseomonas indoligenes]